MSLLGVATGGLLGGDDSGPGKVIGKAFGGSGGWGYTGVPGLELGRLGNFGRYAAGGNDYQMFKDMSHYPREQMGKVGDAVPLFKGLGQGNSLFEIGKNMVPGRQFGIDVHNRNPWMKNAFSSLAGLFGLYGAAATAAMTYETGGGADDYKKNLSTWGKSFAANQLGSYMANSGGGSPAYYSTSTADGAGSAYDYGAAADGLYEGGSAAPQASAYDYGSSADGLYSGGSAAPQSSPYSDYGPSADGLSEGGSAAPQSSPGSQNSAPSAGRSTMFNSTNYKRAQLLKSALGAYQNYQQQQAVAGDMEARQDAIDWARRAEKNPMLVYQRDPGLRAMRQRQLGDLSAQYRARYGGTEGGAFARDLVRTGSAFDRQAVNDAIQRRYQMVGLMQPSWQANMNAGGTTGGAIAGALQQGVGDYMANDRYNNSFDAWLNGGR